MTTTLQTPVTYASLRGQRFEGEDFSGRDFTKADMRVSVFSRCNFDDANMTEADCTGSDFVGSTFRRTNCYRTNFKDAKLGATVFEPKDCFGMTITMNCKTFQNAEMSQLWFYAFLMFAASTIPARKPVNENLRDKLIALIGAERFVKLTGLFERREL